MSDMVVMPKQDWVAALDAAREKGGTDQPLKSGELAQAIQAISADSGEEPPFSVKITNGNDGFRSLHVAGQFTKATIDMNNMSSGYQGVAQMKYFTLGDNPNGVRLDVINVPDIDVIRNDFFRMAGNLREVHFHPAVYPTNVGRFIYQCNAGNYSGPIKITGVSLDRITSFSSGFEGKDKELDYVWQGELKQNADFSASEVLSQASIKRLVHQVADYSAGEAHTLTLGTAFQAMLSPEDIAFANGRNWTLA